MNILKFFIMATLGICIGAFLYGAIYKAYADKQAINTLLFSTTAEWDPLVYAQKTIRNPIVGESAFEIELPLPPRNSSRETKNELAYMHELETKRTTAQLIEIERELALEGAFFGTKTYGDIVQERPVTSVLLMRVLAEISGIVITKKEHFDRVRANKLDETLHPAISVPGHPAYPSGHATQSMIIALVLGDLDPASADAYKGSAFRIAHNREIAGVHYPSDSTAGQQLAEAYFDLLKNNAEYQKLRDAAKAEWE